MEEARLLADVGIALRAQVSEIEVRLPSQLARRCVEAWERDDQSVVPSDETPPERAARHRAGTVALIGLAVKELGAPLDGDVLLSLDVGVIGLAMDAADEGA